MYDSSVFYILTNTGHYQPLNFYKTDGYNIPHYITFIFLITSNIYHLTCLLANFFFYELFFTSLAHVSTSFSFSYNPLIANIHCKYLLKLVFPLILVFNFNVVNFPLCCFAYYIYFKKSFTTLRSYIFS